MGELSVNLIELRQIIIDSSPDDWHKIYRQGPTYRDRFGEWSSPANGTSGLNHDSHVSTVVFINDIDLTISYGMSETHRDGSSSLDFKWSENFADKKIHQISLADIFWRGSLVDRVNFVNVDGARAVLPLGDGNQGLRITAFEQSVARLLDWIEGNRQFESYYDRVDYEVVYGR